MQGERHSGNPVCEETDVENSERNYWAGGKGNPCHSHIFLFTPLCGLVLRGREAESEVEGVGESGVDSSLGPSRGGSSGPGSQMPPGTVRGGTGQGITGPVTGSEDIPGTCPGGKAVPDPDSGGPQGGLLCP